MEHHNFSYMIKDVIALQQCQWITEDYKSIIESPDAYGYDSLNGHFDEIIADIKEDVEQAFMCEIDKEIIINEIRRQNEYR